VAQVRKGEVMVEEEEVIQRGNLVIKVERVVVLREVEI
jgi:hypothetical protein